MVGIVDKYDSSRFVPAQVQCMDTLEPDKLPAGVFHLIIIGNGSMVAAIDGKECLLEAHSVLCLNERRTLTIQSGHVTDVQVISFLPQFLNVHMTPEFLRAPTYTELCDAHAFFQLSPFLTDDVSRMSFHLCEDTFSHFQASAKEMARNFLDQPDWYWSCRARSCFMDIVSVLERLFYDYYLPDVSEDTLYSAKMQQEFYDVIVYINNHLHEKITLSHVYEVFRLNKNKLQDMFQSYLGETFKEYVDRRRYEEASYYLRFTNLVGEEIADRLSFATAQYFSRFFLRMSGQTPEEFRKEKVIKRKIDMAELHRVEQKSRTAREKDMYS